MIINLPSVTRKHKHVQHQRQVPTHILPRIDMFRKDRQDPRGLIQPIQFLLMSCGRNEFVFVVDEAFHLGLHVGPRNCVLKIVSVLL